MREAGLPPALVRGVVAGGAPFGYGLGVFVRFLVIIDPMMCRDPVDSGLIVSSEYTEADLC